MHCTIHIHKIISEICCESGALSINTYVLHHMQLHIAQFKKKKKSLCERVFKFLADKLKLKVLSLTVSSTIGQFFNKVTATLKKTQNIQVVYKCA